MRFFWSTCLATMLLATPAVAAPDTAVAAEASLQPVEVLRLDGAEAELGRARFNATVASWLGGMAMPAGTGFGHVIAGEPARGGWVSLGTLGLETGGLVAGYQLGAASVADSLGADSTAQARSLLWGLVGASVGYAVTATVASAWAAWDVYHLSTWQAPPTTPTL